MLSKVSNGAIIFTAVFWGATSIFTIIQIYKLSKKKGRNNQIQAEMAHQENCIKEVFGMQGRLSGVACSVQYGRTDAEEDFGETTLTMYEREDYNGYTVIIEFIQMAGKPFSCKMYGYKPIVSLGRGKECDIHINDPAVSRHHADILYMNGNLYIEDKNSSNSTFIDKQKILPGLAVQLTQGTVVRMGKTKFRIYKGTD